MLRVVTDDEGRAEMRSALDEIVLDGAQRMLVAALEAEVDAYIAALVNERDERGRRHVVRNGHAEPRTITTAAGRIEVEAPRVNDRRVDEAGERCRFRSSILPPWARKSPKVTEGEGCESLDPSGPQQPPCVAGRAPEYRIERRRL